ncbi:hypothetical protein BH10ACI1_BH10ACI1_17970 [soil metagenome]
MESVGEFIFRHFHFFGSELKASRLSVPEGQDVNSHAIYRGGLLKVNQSPGGTTESFVPTGLKIIIEVPAINCGAINTSSYGA